MSLNRSEIEATRADLRRHLDASGLTPDDLAAWLGVPSRRVDEALAVEGADPALVWYVRDALDAEVRRKGTDAGAWTVLSDAARRTAQAWFRLHALPPRDASASS